ncbi:hypothetical protein [Streptomyces omiyaensis]|uniref:hypothetical protein n=1 Tax=Streptomyces omiyaensis TaxID=68247 RepID=UPI001678651D|nr:hypothetical protein [Streptomyces omiyaensis]
MNRFVFWTLVTLCAALVSWGAAISNWDLLLLGAFVEAGVIGVDLLLLRADRHEAGEEL